MGVFTETVVPVFGNILATIMLVSPLPAVLRLRETGKLGDTNPLPYPMTSVNAIGWVAYGYAVENPWVFPANIIGFLAGLFFSLTAFSCANRKLQDRITALLVVASGYFIMLGIISTFGLTKQEAGRLWGTSAVVILMCYYVVPLSTMVSIVRTRNAASIYPPLAAAAICNGSLWTVYGFAIGDINLWLPNLFGAFIGGLQLALRMVYGARATDGGAAGSAMVTRGDEEAAFAAAQKASGPPQVEERVDSSSNLLIPGLQGSSALGLGAAPGGPTANGGVDHGGLATAATPAAPPEDPGPVGALAAAQTAPGPGRLTPTPESAGA